MISYLWYSFHLKSLVKDVLMKYYHEQRKRFLLHNIFNINFPANLFKENFDLTLEKLYFVYGFILFASL